MRRGDWDKIRSDWLEGGKPNSNGIWKQHSKGFATTATNALRAYFDDEGTILWITFYAGDLYWCFLQPGEPLPVHDERETSIRKVQGKWSNLDVNKKVLSRNSLPGAVNIVSMFQGTTCLVRASVRLLRRINGEISPEVRAVEAARDALEESVKALVGDLSWQDFEVLADLIMSGSGWRRVDRIGGTEKTVDLDLELPLTGELAFAQVKAASSQGELDRYVAAAKEKIGYKMFYVHNSDAELLSDVEGIYVIGRGRVAELVVRLGLVSWLVKKTS